jgi:hypothetical protein
VTYQYQPPTRPQHTGQGIGIDPVWYWQERSCHELRIIKNLLGWNLAALGLIVGFIVFALAGV